MDVRLACIMNEINTTLTMEPDCQAIRENMFFTLTKFSVKQVSEFWVKINFSDILPWTDVLHLHIIKAIGRVLGFMLNTQLRCR